MPSFLNTIVLERLAENCFKIVGEMPAWFTQIYPSVEADAELFKYDGRCYFLNDFLVEAEIFWQRAKQHGRRFCSGEWIEKTGSGEELYLEACAVFLDDAPALLIESLGAKYTARQAELQAARAAILQEELRECAARRERAEAEN